MNLAIFLIIRDASLEHARASLESLDRTLSPRWRSAIAVVDQTTAGFREPLPRPGWRTVRAGRNDAIRTTDAPAVCLLEAGTILMPGWLPPIWRLLHRADRAGCVGNIYREPYSGLIDHAGIGFDTGGLPVALGRNLALPPPETSDRRAAVSLACCLLRREMFTQLNGFDPRFHGALGDVDFCLRAAECGYQHHVANRSVVYRYGTAGLVNDDPDLPLYRERWGWRAARCHARRDRWRNEGFGSVFSPEHWEMAREARRQQRLEIRDVRGKGGRYLRKHWFRPWRYNAGRTARALGQALAPLPAALPLLPGHPADLARADDGWLFDPPPQP